MAKIALLQSFGWRCINGNKPNILIPLHFTFYIFCTLHVRIIINLPEIMRAMMSLAEQSAVIYDAI